MWISRYVTDNSFSADKPTVGEVRSASQQRVTVSATSEHYGLPLLAPCGIAYVPRRGDSSLVIPTEAGDVCAGVISSPDGDLEPGELMLYSSGGASIVLKNDGRVLINGRSVD